MISIHLPQIQKGKDSILINDFHQAPIIPKSGYIPTGMQCGTSNSSVTANVDKLLTADVTSTGVVQVCPELHVNRWDWQMKKLWQFSSVSKYTKFPTKIFDCWSISILVLSLSMFFSLLDNLLIDWLTTVKYHNIEVTINELLFQILAGSSYYWKVDNSDINKFSEGYVSKCFM